LVAIALPGRPGLWAVGGAFVLASAALGRLDPPPRPARTARARRTTHAARRGAHAGRGPARAPGALVAARPDARRPGLDGGGDPHAHGHRARRRRRAGRPRGDSLATV